MSFQTILIESPLPADGFKSVCDLAPGPYEGLQSLSSYAMAVAGGQQAAKLTCNVGAVKASGTIVQTSTGAANGETFKLLGVTFTALTSGATPGAAEWNRNNTVATSAANLAAAINGYADFDGIITASASGGTVTVTSVVPGVIGNGLFMEDVDLANTTVTSFANGSDGTVTVIDFL